LHLGVAHARKEVPVAVIFGGVRLAEQIVLVEHVP
jgi:hypothetical protein